MKFMEARSEYRPSSSRRQLLRLGVATAVALHLPAGLSRAANNDFIGAIERFTAGKVPEDGAIRLDAPEIADNGGAVPVYVGATGARRIALFADGNPNPEVAVVSFGKTVLPGINVRIRLARSQNLIAVAEMADGTYRKRTQWIAVTVGGCA